jgi:hypothetical protein
MWSNVYVCERESSKNQNSSTMGLDRQQHDHPVAFVTANFVSLRFHSLKKTACFKNISTVQKSENLDCSGNGSIRIFGFSGFSGSTFKIQI